MTKKRSSVLPTKINELDRLINKPFCDDQLDNLSLQRAEIEQSLTFVKNLLSAEMASHPTKQHYLENMLKRVRELEEVYRGSGTCSGTTVSTIDHVDNVGDLVDVGDDDDQASKCSACSESCLQDGDVSDDLESTLGQDTEDFVDLVEEKKAMPVTVFDNVLFEEEKVDDDRVTDGCHDRVEYVVFDDASYNGASVEDGSEEKEKEFRVEDWNEEKEIRAEVDMRESEKQSRGLGFGKLCWAVLSGVVIIGMFSMVLLESLEYDGYEGHGQFLTPT